MAKIKDEETEEKKVSKPKKGENNEDVSKNSLAAMLKGYKDDHYNDVHTEEYKISSGSLVLDSVVTITSGSVIRFIGPTESGKSSEAILLINNYLETVPHSKGFYVKSEGRFSNQMQARSKAKIVFSAEEWDEGTIFCLESNVFETVCDMVENLLRQMYEKGQRIGIIFDSLDGFILRKDLHEKTSISENAKVAGVPALSKQMFRRLSLPINKYGALLIILSQVSSAINLDPYSKEPPRFVSGAGGVSVNHQSDIIIEVRGPMYNKDYILENEDEKMDFNKNKIIGHYTTFIIKKSPSDVSGSIIRLPIKRGRQFNSFFVEKEICDMILQWDMAKREKAWVYFSEDVVKEAKVEGIELEAKIHGLPAFYKYLEDNKNVCDWFYGKFKKVLV